MRHIKYSIAAVILCLCLKASAMTLDLGELDDNINVTSDYSNAVLQAVLPYFNNVAKKLDLPVSLPITQHAIAKCSILANRQTCLSITLTNGCVFSFSLGFVDMYVSPRSPSYSHITRDKINSNHQSEITEREAVQLARDSIQKLGISLEDVFADREPEVTTFNKPFTNSVVRYRIQWLEPYGTKSADFIINPQTKEIERFHFSPHTNLHHDPPKTDVVASNVTDNNKGLFLSQIPPQQINPEYARQLIPIMFKAVDDYAEKLSLPIGLPLNTNNVAKIKIFNNGGWEHAEIWLTNNWRFIYRHTMVNGYYAPTVFVSSGYRHYKLEEFTGKWNLNTNQAIELVKAKLAKLDFPTNNIHMDFAPNIIFAAGDFRQIIPRYYFEWFYENATHDDLQSKVEAEVNADTGTVESLYYDDQVYWDSRPPIDVPITIKQ